MFIVLFGCGVCRVHLDSAPGKHAACGHGRVVTMFYRADDPRYILATIKQRLRRKAA